MANIMDMSLYKIAAATTEPAFADVQKKLDQSFGLFMDVTIPMRQENIESSAMRQGLQQTVSAAGSALGTWATGGFNQLSSMFAKPATTNYGGGLTTSGPYYTPSPKLQTGMGQLKSRLDSYWGGQ